MKTNNLQKRFYAFVEDMDNVQKERDADIYSKLIDVNLQGTYDTSSEYKQKNIITGSSGSGSSSSSGCKSNVEVTKVTIREEINSINDLIGLCEKFPLSSDVEYNIDMKMIHDIHSPLKKLNQFVGMKELKENIVDQILYYIQNIQTNDDYMHICLYGPPGTGKTEVAKIIGDIFSKIGILKKNTFKKVVRSDLIAGYLGQTAIKTKKVITEAIGGVLFIDEAYSLGHPNKDDSFSKECIDTLCESLSDHKKDLIVIIAGYENEMRECFFRMNSGLESRFTWKYKIDNYKHDEMYKIFESKIDLLDGWSLLLDSEKDTFKDKKTNEKMIYQEWFKNKMKQFKAYGRDIEKLLSKIKIVHSRRVYCLDEVDKRKITKEDVENGYSLYLKHSKEEEKEYNYAFGMFT